MSKTVLHDGDEGVTLIVRDAKGKRSKKAPKPELPARQPVHVVYGGGHLFKAGTPDKLGRIALESLAKFASGADGLARAMHLPGSELLPTSKKRAAEMERVWEQDPDSLKAENHNAWLACSVYHRTKAKLETEPVEDIRIDFEDGYGFRPDTEEDEHAVTAALELSSAFRDDKLPFMSGFRVKSYAGQTRKRANRTLHIFFETFLDSTGGKLPQNFVVNLPKVTDKKEVEQFCRDLKKIEKKAALKEGSIRIEIMVEHPLALFDGKGGSALRGIAEAARGRCIAAHFGAYDYTAVLGIAASYQDITHPACDFARQMMLAALSPLGIRLSDSVTTQMPVAVHKGDDLTESQQAENSASVHFGWRTHFSNVRRSMANGFYQSWDLHPNQLVARYAAVYSFFLESAAAQGSRLRGFLDKATQATLTGNEFDDAASAMGIVNFFRQGLDCGAFIEAEIENAAGISAADLRSLSFAEFSAKADS